MKSGVQKYNQPKKLAQFKNKILQMNIVYQ